MRASDKVDTRNNNRVGMIIRPDFEDRVVARVESKIDIRVFYGLDLLIPADDYAENLLFCNLNDILANFFNDLSSTSIKFRFCPAFFIFSSYSSTFDSVNSLKSLNFTFFSGLATCNLNNILAFYY